MKIICAICGREMQMVLDTPLCPVCNADIIYELNVYIKKDLKDMKVKK